MDAAATKKNCSGRISKQQKRRLLQLMQQHRCVGKGQFTTPNARVEHSQVWTAVAAELNALGGTNKTVAQWKKSWIDWKSSVKKQYNAHRCFARRTGNLPLEEGPKDMDAMDTEVLEFFSRDMVDGDGETPEIVVVPNAPNIDAIVVEDEVVELSIDDIVNQVPRQRSTGQSCVQEAQILVQSQHEELKSLMVSQHNAQMTVFEGIHQTLKQMLEKLDL